MNVIVKGAIVALRKIYSKLFPAKTEVYDRGITDPDKASELIYNLLDSGKPCMIARYGAFELASVVNYLGVRNPHHSLLKYITGKELQWWWNKRLMGFMQTNAGFFPATEENLMKFGEMMVEDSKQVDILGSWLSTEQYLNEQLKSASRVHLMQLEPFWGTKPWSRALKGKRVLVVHPFSETIKTQYNKRHELFLKDETLPDFGVLEVVRAVQSIGGESSYKDWFDALNFMKSEIEKHDFDVCLVGCGAYGFPLAAHVKRMGKQAVHLGGALQLLFGIRGNRWEDPNYGVKEWSIPSGTYSGLSNEYWVRPSKEEKPKTAGQVEGSCYW